jgi:hypothetical protein
VQYVDRGCFGKRPWRLLRHVQAAARHKVAAGEPPGVVRGQQLYAAGHVVDLAEPSQGVRSRVSCLNPSGVASRAASVTVSAGAIDVLATRTGRTLAVEVKGFPGRRYAGPRRAEEVKPTT